MKEDEAVMPTANERIISAPQARLQAQPATVLRGDFLLRCVSALGLLILGAEKLGVSSCRSAVRRAEELDLLQRSHNR